MLKASNRGKLLLFSALSLVLAGLGCAPVGRQPLIVGMELNYPPFEMIDARGQATGISVDLVISAMTAPRERAQSIAFSEPYLRTGLCLLVNRHANLHSIEQADQPGCAIVVKQGTTGQLYARAHLRRAWVLV